MPFYSHFLVLVLLCGSSHPNTYFLFQNSHLERPDSHEVIIRIPLWDLSSKPRLDLFHPLISTKFCYGYAPFVTPILLTFLNSHNSRYLLTIFYWRMKICHP